jgi:putative ABC transport system substrate-binding protein
MGFVEGRNVTIEYRFANDVYDRLPELAADLVRRRVAVIASFTLQAALAAKAATATIPIVFRTGGDPVQYGLVASFNRPGGNVTGINDIGFDLGPKRLGLLHDLLPGALRFAILVDPTNAATESMIRDIRAAHRSCHCQHQQRDRHGLCDPCKDAR